MFLCTTQTTAKQVGQLPGTPRVQDRRNAVAGSTRNHLRVFDALAVSRMQRAEIEIEQHARLRDEALKK
jgi:hypothetical protein